MALKDEYEQRFKEIEMKLSEVQRARGKEAAKASVNE